MWFIKSVHSSQWFATESEVFLEWTDFTCLYSATLVTQEIWINTQAGQLCHVRRQPPPSPIIILPYIMATNDLCEVCQITQWWMEYGLIPSLFQNIATNVELLCSVYKALSNERGLSFLAQVWINLSDLSILLILELAVHIACTETSSRINDMLKYASFGINHAGLPEVG